MKRVRDLIPLAKKLDGFAFAKQMGPFVLMQRPSDLPKVPLGTDWQSSTARLPPQSNRVLPTHAPPSGASTSARLVNSGSAPPGEKTRTPSVGVYVTTRSVRPKSRSGVTSTAMFGIAESCSTGANGCCR